LVDLQHLLIGNSATSTIQTGVSAKTWLKMIAFTISQLRVKALAHTVDVIHITIGARHKYRIVSTHFHVFLV
jgi:hypothetical protein